MKTEQHFLDAILANPEDDLIRLVFADWLEEHDDPRAELIRIQLQLRKIVVQDREELETRMRELLYEQNITPVVPTFTNSIGMKFALIPSGEFMMGSPEEEVGREDDEDQVRVEISKPFFLGVYLVTQTEYEHVTGSNPSYYSQGREAVQGMDTGRIPVDGVSWQEASEFCERLAEKDAKEGWIYRLPMEAEWEYACRAGTTTPYYFGDSLSSHQANFNGLFPYGNAVKGPNLARPKEVGGYQPNSFGLYDMHGNVLEWCQNLYEDDNYETYTADEDRVFRGGGWDNVAVDLRSACRNHYYPNLSSIGISFRCAIVQEMA